LVIGVDVPDTPNEFKNHIKARRQQRLELRDRYQETRNGGISANIRNDLLEARLEFCEHFVSVALDQFEARVESVTASQVNTRLVTDRPWLDSSPRRRPRVSGSPSDPAPLLQHGVATTRNWDRKRTNTAPPHTISKTSVLPELRRHSAHFVQVGRSQLRTTAAGGITIASYTTQPATLHASGD
jgi:hypothetical protein